LDLLVPQVVEGLEDLERLVLEDLSVTLVFKVKLVLEDFLVYLVYPGLPAPLVSREIEVFPEIWDHLGWEWRDLLVLLDLMDHLDLLELVNLDHKDLGVLLENTVVVECLEDQVQLGPLATVSFVRPSRCKPIVEDRRKVNPLLMDQCKCPRTDFFCKMLQITAIVVTIISWWLLGKELLASNPTNHSVSPKKLVTNLLLNVVIFISHVRAIHHSSICKLVPYNHKINYYS